MNKLLTKIVGVALGATMAVGVGVAAVKASDGGMQRADAAESTVSWTASSGSLGTVISNVGGTATGNISTGSFSWAYTRTLVNLASGKSDYISMNNGYMQLGSSNAGESLVLSTSNIPGTIKSVSVLCGSKSQSHTISIDVGNTNYLSSTCPAWSSNSGDTITGTGSSSGEISISFDVGSKRNPLYLKTISVTYDDGSTPTPITYTDVTVSEKTPLTGNYKGSAYYECNATVTGTGSFSTDVTWSLTSTNTYGTGATVTDLASIDSNGKIVFLNNGTVYAWATAADEETHNTIGFVVIASGLVDNPMSSFVKVTDASDVSVRIVYTLSNDGSSFIGKSVSNSKIQLVTSPDNLGYIVLEQTSGGYHIRFATYSAGEWNTDGKYINYSGSSTDLSSSNTASTVWTLATYSGGVYLKISGGRHLGLDGNGYVKAYAAANIAVNLPVYLYEADNLPDVHCALIELTGAPEDSMSIGDTATLGFTAYDENLDPWSGDVVYSISNESTSGVVELSATSGANVTLTAKKAGTARVSVQDQDEYAEPDYVDITVLSDPTRVDLPVGTYTVLIDYSSIKKDDPVPASKEYEIKPKEGSGSSRVWYKNMSVSYENVTAKYNSEYTWTTVDTSIMTLTNNSNAKVVGLEIKYYDAKRLTVLDASSATIPEASSSSNTVIYELDSASFSLKANTATTSAYYIKITFNVIDESEEFYNLVVSKSASWDKTNYKDGQSPSNEGLVVTANYTNDGGETISRSEDVTEFVSEWAYTPANLTTSNTYFDVVATWNGHSSASFRVTGITVAPITGWLDDGSYFIYTDSLALDRTTYSSGTPKAGVNLTSAASWTFELVDDDTYTISATINSNKLYLAGTSGSAKGLKTQASPSNWELDYTDDGFTLYNLDASRYLSFYSDNSDWRTYTTPTYLEIVDEKEVFADNFLNSFTVGCIASGGYDADDMNWTGAATQFGTLSLANQTIFQEAEYTISGSGDQTVVVAESGTDQKIAEAVARYDYIVAKYGTSVFDDFMARTDGTNRINPINKVNNTVAIVVVVTISLVSVSALGAYFLLRKKKEER